jgi:restriction endonuclease Mrr
MRTRRASGGMRKACRYWILHALAVEPQGRAPLSAVYRHVEKNLGPHFTSRERADVPSGGEQTWTNDVRQERRNMIKDGLLVDRNDGIWQLTDAGRALLKRYAGAPTFDICLDQVG